MLVAVVSFIYMGKLVVVKECAVELLKVGSILQLEDHQLVEEVKLFLVEEAKQADTFQELF